jgi:hypothetical protein
MSYVLWEVEFANVSEADCYAIVTKILGFTFNILLHSYASGKLKCTHTEISSAKLATLCMTYPDP